jgi:hypothetical protein
MWDLLGKKLLKYNNTKNPGTSFAQSEGQSEISRGRSLNPPRRSKVKTRARACVASDDRRLPYPTTRKAGTVVPGSRGKNKKDLKFLRRTRTLSTCHWLLRTYGRRRIWQHNILAPCPVQKYVKLKLSIFN